jgi:HK97 gp10 family phage protein
MQLHGMTDVQQAIKRAPEETRARLGQAIEATTFAVASRARSLAPRDTGTLAAAISSSVRGLNGSVTIGGEAYYWRFVEYGTRFKAARPFVRAAVESESGAFETRIRSIATGLERDFSAGRFT